MGDSSQTANKNQATINLLPEVSSDELVIEDIPESDVKFVHFDLGNISNDGAVLRGRIPMMRPPESYKLPAPQDLQVGVQWVEDWMLKNKLVHKHEKEKRAKSRQIAQDLFLLFAFCIPEQPLAEERVYTLIAGIQLIFVVDDIIEETNLLGRNQSTGVMAANYIDQVLKGNHEFDPDENVFPSLRKAAKAGQLLIKKAQEYSSDFHSRSVHFANSVKATYFGVYLLQVADAKAGDEDTATAPVSEDNDTMSEDIFIYLRRADAAGLPQIEIALYAKEISFPPEIRDNLFFKKFLEVVEEIVGHQNDLLGLEKDIKNYEWNIVLFKVKKYGIPLQDAFQAVVQLVGRLTKELVYLKSRLLKLYPDNEDLEEFFEIVSSILDANGYLLLYTERHGDLRSAFTKLNA